ncbi:hypothetical protein KVT40_009278 [Elsinoe batatas]|uniref:DUF647-domain-containing protein n=1 Tax=Elsinoe batatas TaxID=2601811 RepID=A0A8K0KSM6_9PEZI|nr:hypothetical protein KVT40_009278 [Elsinoe batatas]
MSHERADQATSLESHATAPERGLPENDGMRDLREKMHEIRELALSTEETAKRMHGLMVETYQSRNKPLRTRSSAPKPTQDNTPTPVEFHLTSQDKEPSYHPDTNVQDELDELLDQETEPILGCKHYKRNVKSAVNMELQWRKLDDEIRMQPMPEEDFEDESVDTRPSTADSMEATDSRLSAGLRNLGLTTRSPSQRRRLPRRVWVGCNDCGGRGWTPFHWLGLKCPVCDGYNTNQLTPTGSSDTRFISGLPETALQRQHDFTGATVLRSFDDPDLATAAEQPRSDLLAAQSPTRSNNLNPSTPSRSYFLSSSPSSAPSAHSPRSWASSLSPTRLTGLRSSTTSSDPDAPPRETESDYLTLAMARLDRFGVAPSEFLARVGISPSEFLARLNISPPDFLERFGVSPFDFLQKVGRSLSPMRHYLESLDRDARERVGKAGERMGEVMAGLTEGGRWSRRDVAEGMERWETYWRNEGQREEEKRGRKRRASSGDGEVDGETGMGFWGGEEEEGSEEGTEEGSEEGESESESGSEGEEEGEEESTHDQVRIDIIVRFHPSHSFHVPSLPLLTTPKRPPSTLLSLPTRLLHLFLPTGYPHSVTPDYLPYQTYDSLQAFTSSIASLLSSRAVLSTLGVGDASASPTLAILLSILQDSLGRVTTILFAHRLGNALEPECKFYRLAADVFNDVAMVLECLSPAFPRTGRVAVLAGASALKALCGVAAGSSKASLSAHFARWGNLAELNAKDSSQETVISLVGMLVGGAVVGYVREGTATWVVLLGLLGAHLWLNWMAVKSVRLGTLNRQRAGVVFGGWTEGGRVLGPEEVRGRERVFERDGVIRGLDGRILGWASIGLSFEEFLGRVGMARGQGQHAFDIGRSVIDGIGVGNEGSQQRYLIHLDIGSRHCFITLEKSSVVRDQLHAWFTAYRALQLLGRGVPLEHGDGDQQVKGKSTTDANGLVGQATASELLRAAQEYVGGEFPTLMSRLEDAGWDLKTGALETRRGIRFARVR